MFTRDLRRLIFPIFWMVLSLFLLELAGCKSSAIPGATPILMESKRSTPIQRCIATPGFRAQLDQAVQFVGEEMQREGLITPGEAALRGGDTPIACMIEQPEPCVLTPHRCDRVVHAQCARKRGCAHAVGLFVSKLWPPICRSWWPDEPHCVVHPSMQSTAGFVRDLCKEVCEVFCARRPQPCTCYHGPTHNAFMRAARRMTGEQTTQQE